VYRAYIEDQYLDITEVRGGRYVLVNRVNADHALAETGYRNNAASVLIDLRWPDGRDRFPAVRVLARCPHSARCSE
jgi:Lysyl oxidase